MQFANDITPLTLASTADLRHELKMLDLHCAERLGIEMEIEFRALEQKEIRFNEFKLYETNMHPMRHELSRPFMWSEEFW